MRVCLGLALAAVLGFAGILRADPLDLKQVDADAKWAVHVDIDAARASTVLQNVYQLLSEKHPDIEKRLGEVREKWQFNPADIHDVTFYGQQFKKGEGVAIVHATVDQQALLEKAKQAPNHKVGNHGKYELHSWTHAAGSKHERSMTGTFFKPDVLVFGSSEAEVGAALDVLDGTKPNMADKQPSLVGTIPPGTILVAGARDLSEIKLPAKSPVAPVVKQADSMILSIGEHDGNSFLAATVNVKQTEVAQQLKAIVDGFRAAAAIKQGDDPEALKILNALKVSVTDKTVTVDWTVPADAVWAHVQKQIEKHGDEMCQKIREHMEKQWHEHHPSDEK